MFLIIYIILKFFNYLILCIDLYLDDTLRPICFKTIQVSNEYLDFESYNISIHDSDGKFVLIR